MPDLNSHVKILPNLNHDSGNGVICLIGLFNEHLQSLPSAAAEIG